MSPVFLANLHLIKAAMIATLLGLFVRGAHRLCWPFTAYLWTALTYNVLVSFWPETFYRFSFWAAKEALYGALRLAIAVSIAGQAFELFPKVRTMARAAYVAIGMAMALIVLQFPSGDHDSPEWKLELVKTWNARLLAATIVAFCVVSFLVAYFRVPIQTFHRQLLLAFTAWLAIAAGTRDVLGIMGAGVRDWSNAVESIAALGLNTWCAVVAWRHHEEILVSGEAAAALTAFSRAT